jgi:hypothetical protein
MVRSYPHRIVLEEKQMNDDVKELPISDIYKFSTELIDKGYSPYAIAAMFTLVALQIYKTSMSTEEYNLMVDMISNNRDRVQTLPADAVGSLH